MRISWAWELGGGSGHLARWQVVSNALVQRGHQVTSILRQPVDNGDKAVLPAPTWSSVDASTLSWPIRTWVDVLLKTAWRPGLADQVIVWRRLLTENRPDVLVADYAPTALLAARGMGVPCVTIGTGFSRPPRGRILTDLRRTAGLAVDPDPETPARTALALDRANQALATVGGPPLVTLDDLFADASDLRCGFGMLDPHGPRPHEQCQDPWLGTLPSPSHPAAIWPTGSGPRVLVYVRQGPIIDAALVQLARWGVRLLVMSHATSAIDLPRAARESDLVICNGNYGVVAHALRAGKPTLLLPTDIEKGLITARVMSLGAGRIADARRAVAITDTALRLLADTKVRSSAERFGTAHRRHDPNETLYEVCRRVIAVGASD